MLVIDDSAEEGPNTTKLLAFIAGGALSIKRDKMDLANGGK